MIIITSYLLKQDNIVLFIKKKCAVERYLTMQFATAMCHDTICIAYGITTKIRNR